MRIQLSEHFTYGKLLRFTFPSIVMMIFTSIYSVVDGVFVSNFAGKTPFAAINLIMPLLIIAGAPGFMVGAGGSAIVAKAMGQGKPELANRYFSLLVCAAAVSGAAVGWLGAAFARPIASALGAEGEMLEYCVLYARIILAANPFFILQRQFLPILFRCRPLRLLYIQRLGHYGTHGRIHAGLLTDGSGAAACQRNGQSPCSAPYGHPPILFSMNLLLHFPRAFCYTDIHKSSRGSPLELRRGTAIGREKP